MLVLSTVAASSVGVVGVSVMLDTWSIEMVIHIVELPNICYEVSTVLRKLYPWVL